MERELHRQKTEALELQNRMERSRLQQLRSQIDPHFLFNTPVSYTHLDVYKRQAQLFGQKLRGLFFRQGDLDCGCLLYTSRCV